MLADGDTPDVRSVVRESWMRSLRGGVDPSSTSTVESVAGPDDFSGYRAAHPMTAVRPMVRSLMLDDIAGTGVVMALTDEHGRLLWVEGDHEARDRAAAIDFVEGAVWAEEVVGTNAPGVALAVDRGVQIVGAEHFAEPVQGWNCAAAPVHDPVTGHVIGVLDVTGGNPVAAPFALSAVRSVVSAIELHLRMGAVDLSDLSPRDDTARPAAVSVLDADGSRWVPATGPARRLSPRHAEILLLLAWHREGLSTEQLALALSEDGVDAVTVRAEISRLRRDLGSDVVLSRPYRAGIPITCDLADVVDRARGGDVAGAVAVLGRGGLAADSRAPGVVAILEEVLADLRGLALGGSDPAGLRAWTSSVHGRDDATAWHALAQRTPSGTVEAARARGRAALVDRRLGVQL
ncbi:GAF domain-containing protein [uncultured Williamsia sp.]|uniref:GAF domain-containing protein n=1 Tax=uncultured Williamsia sp. TaxID=259311 RepID=UPI00262DEBE2|nr:GAF domain-containing protein [uncultured Williamsia sp.]